MKLTKSQGKEIRILSFSRPLRIFSAALEALIIMGIGKVFLSVMRLFTKPGQITDTLIWSLLRTPCKASPYAFTKALEAE